MATHSSILAWRIPWTEELGRLQSEGHKESDMTEQVTHTHTLSKQQQLLAPLRYANLLSHDQITPENLQSFNIHDLYLGIHTMSNSSNSRKQMLSAFSGSGH